MNWQVRYLIKSEVNAQKIKAGNMEFLVNCLPNLVCRHTYMAFAWLQKGFKEALSASFGGVTSQARSINHDDCICSGDGRGTSYTPLPLVKGCLIPGQGVCSLTLLTCILWPLRQLWKIMVLPGLLYQLLGIRDGADQKARPFHSIK